MFTGIVEEVGKVTSIREERGTRRMTVSASNLIKELKAGDSIAVSGVCLTAVDLKPNSVGFDLAEETWNRTSGGSWPSSRAARKSWYEMRASLEYPNSAKRIWVGSAFSATISGCMPRGFGALGSGFRKGCARKNGYCQLIHSLRPPGSPSGTRRSRRPSNWPAVRNTSSTLSSAILPTR